MVIISLTLFIINPRPSIHGSINSIPNPDHGISATTSLWNRTSMGINTLQGEWCLNRENRPPQKVTPTITFLIDSRGSSIGMSCHYVMCTQLLRVTMESRCLIINFINGAVQHSLRNSLSIRSGLSEFSRQKQNYLLRALPLVTMPGSVA